MQESLREFPRMKRRNQKNTKSFKDGKVYEKNRKRKEKPTVCGNNYGKVSSKVN